MNSLGNGCQVREIRLRSVCDRRRKPGRSRPVWKRGARIETTEFFESLLALLESPRVKARGADW